MEETSIMALKFNIDPMVCALNGGEDYELLCVISDEEYKKLPEENGLTAIGEILDEDGFFDTGDVATIDEMGFMQITDRSKDVIKSGGEWISSIELENVAVGHPDIAEAAVIGVVHPKWDESCLLYTSPSPRAGLLSRMPCSA